MDSHLILLFLAGFLTGLMDGAVGGGGLIQIPALFGILPSSVPVSSVMGINKFASFCGVSTAAAQFVRRIRVPWKMLLPSALLAFAASYAGANLVAYLPVRYLKPFMPAVMVVMVVYTFWKKDLGQAVRKTALTRREYRLGLLFGALIGFYDGLFGPGTGSLLAFVFVRFFAYDFLTATASAKIINVTTNFAALSFFIPHGHIVWAWALPLAAANLLGSIAGAQLAMRGGTRFLRYGFMALLCVLIGKFAWDVFQTF